VQIALAAQDAGPTPIVRGPKADLGLACRLLDGGAMGVMLPHVDTAEEAARFARACRYPPAGVRSYSAGLPQTAFRSLDPVQAIAAVEPMIGLFPQIKTRAGAENVEAIVATPGVDGMLVGLQDLTLDLGIPGQLDAPPRVRAIVKACAEACRRHGKFAGLGGTENMDLMREYLAFGFRFVLIGSDRSFLMQSVTARVLALRKLAPS
jgi:2-keto-3-deoxy-L-rhamnonate aldolase RhmA